jgi:hypothetical protein
VIAQTQSPSTQSLFYEFPVSFHENSPLETQEPKRKKRVSPKQECAHNVFHLKCQRNVISSNSYHLHYEWIPASLETKEKIFEVKNKYIMTVTSQSESCYHNTIDAQGLLNIFTDMQYN